MRYHTITGTQKNKYKKVIIWNSEIPDNIIKEKYFGFSTTYDITPGMDYVKNKLLENEFDLKQPIETHGIQYFQTGKLGRVYEQY